ncbi:MAG: hypothetical protein GX443_12515 [Deltaproteobacteria bacterium]|nr:hypothetical protein [Deltaproteobacteria bacterium]
MKFSGRMPGAWRPLWCLVTVLVAALGCAGESRAFSHGPRVELQPIDVFRRSNIQYYGGAALGVLSFKGPAQMSAAGDEIARIYAQELLKPGFFKDVRFFARSAASQEEAVWLARTLECDLIMEATIQYLLDGSGSMPTHLDIAVKILDARSGTVAWDLGQKASSNPGKEVDLFWSVKKGAPAERYPAMAKALAVQLVHFLAGLPPEVDTGDGGKGKGRFKW